MKVFTTRIAALVALLAAAVAAMLIAAGTASAAPYGGKSLTITVDTTTPCSGGGVTVTVGGTQPGDKVSVVLHTTPVQQLGTLTADSKGGAKGTFTLPADAVGTFDIVAIDTVTDTVATASATLTIKKCSDVDSANVAKPSSGVDALAFTGVTVAAFAVIAIALLAGGIALVLAGRRSKTSSDASAS